MVLKKIYSLICLLIFPMPVLAMPSDVLYLNCELTVKYDYRTVDVSPNFYIDYKNNQIYNSNKELLEDVTMDNEQIQITINRKAPRKHIITQKYNINRITGRVYYNDLFEPLGFTGTRQEGQGKGFCQPVPNTPKF